ncbi:MAG: asparagine--tRNA ligase [Bacillota bacterium]|nr:MAG: asparagine--tRNA ligase [Bacillota bacterium]
MASQEPPLVTISDLGRHAGETVRLRGWVYNLRSSGKIAFVILRDGTGFTQVVITVGAVGDAVFEQVVGLSQESAVSVVGAVRQDSRAPGGFEISATEVEIISPSHDYPIALKEHGPEFLLDHRHLWLRTPRQVALMRLRAGLIKALRDFLDDRGFVVMDSPILTPSACEGTTTLFQTDYFGEPAYLSQSGQLYQEATAMALGRTYCFGPTFRAEKSKTRRHLTEFWMLEPEAAFVDFEENMRIQEDMVSYMVAWLLENRAEELKVLGRDTGPLRNVAAPFPRITYDEAVAFLKEKGIGIEWGDDFGAPHETAISLRFDRPVFVTHFPAAIKAFYMKPDPSRPEVVLGADLLASEGYGEIIGGGQRIDDLDLLQRRLAEHGLPEEPYRWYLDLRRYGSVPHSGFGIGIERTLTWIAGLDHLRETIPFPRMINRIYP